MIPCAIWHFVPGAHLPINLAHAGVFLITQPHPPGWDGSTWQGYPVHMPSPGWWEALIVVLPKKAVRPECKPGSVARNVYENQ